MSRVLFFCLECNKGKKDIDKKSDELYISKLLSAYYNTDDVLIRFSYMHGKNNFQKSHKSAIKECRGLKKDNVIDDYEVILVLDKDNFTSDIRDSQFIGRVESYIESENAIVIWFTKDIEHVLLGSRTTHKKTSKARQFEITPELKVQLKSSLSCKVPNKDRSSNFLYVMNNIID